jgi:ankyrin repeat protein
MRQQQKKHPGPGLYKLALMRQYDQIPAYVKLHPEDIACRDPYGSTALHILCRIQYIIDNDLIRAIDAVLEQDPSVVGKPNHRTWTPLHLACEKRILIRDEYMFKDQLVLKLIKACPDAVSIKFQSGSNYKTAFHICLENDASEEVLREMLRINPRLVTQPCVQNESYELSGYPLQLLWDEIPELHKMELLLRVAFTGSSDDDPNFRVLSAVCSTPCPRLYAAQIITLHDQQIHERDGYGLFPLHHAVRNADGDHQSYTEFVFEWLINEYPEAAKISFGQGNVLPLHVLTADRGIPWEGGVKQLLFAFPEALHTMDPRNRLVPFLASAAHASKSPSHLTTTYELLRAAPDVIQR